MNARRKILVIDNDRDACGLISAALTPKGLEVYSFSDPDEGIARAEEIGPDLVFISILLPGSNGLKISKAVHSIEGLQGVPVIMLISYPDELDPKYTATIGIVDVALKPLDAAEILSKTAAVLGEAVTTGGVPVAEEAGAPSLDEEWVSFLDKGDRKSGQDVEAESLFEGTASGPLPEEGEAGGGSEDERVEDGDVEVAEGAGEPADGRYEEDHGRGDTSAQDDTVSFLREEEEEQPVPPAGEGPEFSEVPRRRSMKKFLVIAAVVIAIAAGAGIEAYRFFQAQEGTSAIPVAKAPLKKAPLAETGKKTPAPEEMPAAAAQKQAAPEAAKAEAPVSGKTATGAAAVTEGTNWNYSVQVGAFRNGNHATALVEKLKKKGYDAFVLDDSTGRVRRVVVGKYGSRSAAAAEAKRMLDREGMKSVIYRH